MDDANTIYQELGENIRIFRKQKKITQVDLGIQINKSSSCISKYEKGEIVIDIVTLIDIANALDVPLETLYPHSAKKSNIEGNHAPLHPYFKNTPLFLFWYNGIEKKIKKCAIKINDNSTTATLFMEPQSATHYTNCTYLMHGEIINSESHTYLYAHNPLYVNDFIFISISNLDLTLSNSICHMTAMSTQNRTIATKGYLSRPTEIPTDSNLLDLLRFNKMDIQRIKSTNFLML
ncbi:MAG: helix-turn-helix transcriptional regulator [Anaerovoracaceae bacterium]